MKEQKALTNGSQEIQESTKESFTKAQKSIEDLLKKAEKTYADLKSVKGQLHEGGRGCLVSIKARITDCQRDLPFISEVQIIIIVIDKETIKKTHT